MQTIAMSDLVNTAFEPCAAFERTDTAPICSGCGWLESEHDRSLAEVRVLLPRAGTGVTPKRLAS